MKKKDKKHQYTGYVGDCSDEQLEALKEFREKITAQGFTDPPYDDYCLLRFLRARKFDLPKVMIMWDNYQAFRQEYKIDTELKSFKFTEDKEVRACYPYGYFRHDKQFRPVFIERTGYIRYDDMMTKTNMDRFMRSNILTFEHLFNVKFPALSELAGKKVQNTVYIMDLKGGAMKILNERTYKFLKAMIKVGQDNYPEILGKMFIINAPLLFYTCWNIIKNFIDEKTRNKIAILGSNYKNELLEIIDEENLPDFLGGKATVDQYGENLINDDGPWHAYERRLKEEAEKKAAEKANPTPIKEAKEVEIDGAAEVNGLNDNKEVLQSRYPNEVKTASLPEIQSWEGEFDGDEMWEVPAVKHEACSMGMMKSMTVRTMPTLETQQEEEIN